MPPRGERVGTPMHKMWTLPRHECSCSRHGFRVMCPETGHAVTRGQGAPGPTPEGPIAPSPQTSTLKRSSQTDIWPLTVVRHPPVHRATRPALGF